MNGFLFWQKTKAATGGVLKTKGVPKNTYSESFQMAYAAKILENYL